MKTFSFKHFHWIKVFCYCESVFFTSSCVTLVFHVVLHNSRNEVNIMAADDLVMQETKTSAAMVLTSPLLRRIPCHMHEGVKGSWYHGCWWPDNTRSQGICSYGTDLFSYAWRGDRKLISWLLMTWQCKEPGHVQPWYWPLLLRKPWTQGINRHYTSHLAMQ